MSPELELIDQLLGGDLPLPVVCGLFTDDDRARRALRSYVSKGVISLTTGKEGVLPQWKCDELFRDAEPLAEHVEIRVLLTREGARAFEPGRWERI
jgi:hypothetical protein